MAKQMAKSGLAGKLGAAGAKAVAAHKDDETKFDSGGRLPSGIEQGIAQLVDCLFDTYDSGDNQGEYFFRAAGVVVSPEAITDANGNNIRIAGLRTQIMEPLCATPTKSRKTIDEHVAWILNEMRKLGADTTNLSLDDLEATAAALKKAAPHFQFRTWKGKKQTTGPYAGQEPRVQENWNGITDFDGDAQAVAVQDDTIEAAEDPVPDDEVAAEASGDVDLAALGEAADGGDEEAAGQLETLAEAQGIDANSIATWGEVASMLAGGEPATEEAAAEPAKPVKGEVWFYRKPRTTKWVECEVTGVFEGTKTVALKNLDSGEGYKAISWEAIKTEIPS